MTAILALADGTVFEGLSICDHPEASPCPHDAGPLLARPADALFAQFVTMMRGQA
jgi:carbamoylphosphate synthase small subunit